jgi:glycogen synthase
MKSECSTKRVLMTADTVGGVWTYAMELIRALEPYGVEVELATMGRRLSKEQWSEACGLKNVRVSESAYKLEWMEEPWEDVRAAGECLLQLAEEFQPDVVHLNGYTHAALPWSVPVVVVGHSCVLSWWKAVKGESAPDNSWNEYRGAVRAGLEAADLVIAPTRAMLDCLGENYCDLPRTRVIPNGRTLALFKPAAKENFILSAGRLWDEAKNVTSVCACSSRLPWPVLVAGELECPDGREMPLGTVRSLGRLSGREVLEWMSRASIFAHPAKYEPFGLSVLEAALSGCALVLGDVPALRENWDDAAVFVDPNDRNELRDALIRLIQDRPEREQLSCAAMERGKQFDIRFTALGYIEAYESLRRNRPCEQEERCAAA